MKRCENCQMTYEDYAEKCSDCGETLIEAPDEGGQKDGPDYQDHIEIRKVYTANSNEEADLILSLLSANGIPTEVRRKGMGSYLNISAGLNYLGTDIYVSEGDYDHTRALLEAEPDLSEMNVEEPVAVAFDGDDFDLEAETYQSRRSNRMRWLLFIGWGIPVLFILGIRVINFFLE